MIIVNPQADYSTLGLGRAFAPITPEVEAIMANYSVATDKMKGALSLFFANIGGTIKAKINSMFLPLFSSTKSEAVFDIISSSSKYPAAGNANNLVFDNENKLLGCNGVSPNWTQYTYSKSTLFGSSSLDGTYGVFAIIPNYAAADDIYSLCGGQFSKVDCAFCAMPADGLTKFRGIVFADISSKVGNVRNYVDRGVVARSGTYSFLNTNDCWAFGGNHTEISGSGVRILVCASGTTAYEEATLRKAIIDLDNIFF